MKNEGIEAGRIYFVGNVMIDTLIKHRQRAKESTILHDLKLQPKEYILVTLHRPANVDDPEIFAGLLGVLQELSKQLPVIFPLHPRTKKQVENFGLADSLRAFDNLRLIEPLGYLDFLSCMDQARFVLTDSGGIQEETTVLGVPCITARENTERPVTVSEGTNVVVGRNPQRILASAHQILRGDHKQGVTPQLWDGEAAKRIVKVLWEKGRQG